MMTAKRNYIRFALLLAPLLLGLPTLQPAQAGTFLPTGAMNSERTAHTATLLLDGRVLVVGGQGPSNKLSSAELYDPAMGVWLPTGSMTNIFGYPTNIISNARAYHTATLLANGKVLVVGGLGNGILSSAQLYDPVAGTWSETGFMNTARHHHTTTLLANGKVLVAGGVDAYGNSTASAELYDPATGQWTEVGPMNATRYQHTATLLMDGKVLISAGRPTAGPILTSAELFDPANGTWTTTGALHVERFDHTAMLLPSGKVLVVGGYNGSYLSSTEIYDPATGTWSVTGDLNVASDAPQATLLSEGKVLVTGGQGSSQNSLLRAELYDSTLGTWTTNGVGVMNTIRFQHTATLLANGKVLLTGGYFSESVYLASAELYDSGVTSATNGYLKVTLSPAGAVSAGALWQVDGGAYLTNGTVVTNLTGGNHIVSFATIPGWVKPADQLLTIVSRTATNVVAGVYTPNPGAIQVTLNPADAVTAGAQWRVDGGEFQTSGNTVSNLSAGEHTVTFKTIASWYAPGGKVVTVVTDTTTNLTGTYSTSAGGLQVNLTPAGAVVAGAQWQVDGGDFQPSGASVTNLSAGDHLLGFKTISGWITPSNRMVGITAANLTVAGVNYGSLATGAVRVNLSPAGAVSAGARWSVDGGAFQTNGAVVTGLAPGNHVVDFKSVPGFFTLAHQTNAVTSNVTNTFTGVYVAGEPTKPTLTLIAPGSGKRYSNEVFTASGTAKDNIRVASVWYRFNTGDWATATTANNFTNWTVPNLVLTPGTNTFQVYAVDTSNNRTTTDTVKFSYVLADRLLVQLNGKGTVSPNYNNALLEIGKGYAMTATAVKGFQFVNWTGSLPTNTAKLAFNMQSNLSFTANFADITRPVNALLTPKASQRWSNLVFTATGKASDNLRVSNVWYQLNTNAWLSAFTVNQFTNWTATNLVLTPGTNTLTTYAVDTTGNRSLTNTVKFIYVLTDRLIVQLNGRGTLSPNYSNAVLEIGRSYTMTATAATGFRFVNWTGSLPTNTAKLAFNMQSNLSFTANFQDISRPVLTLLTPTAKQKWSNVVFTASGKASDNVGINTVWYQLNGTGWNPATLALNHTNWNTPNLTNYLLSGSNQIQAYAADAVANTSLTNTVNFTYLVQPVADWAPDSLNGLLAQVTETHSNRTNTQSVGFDLVTFAQTGTDTNADNYGVGHYLYTKTGTNTAQLALVFTAPPTQTNDDVDVAFVFTNHYGGYFTNNDGGGDNVGGISFVIATNFLPGSVVGKTLLATNTDQATGAAVKFLSSVSFTQTGNGGGNYTLTRFSPVSGLLTLTYTNVARLGQVTYVQTTFTNAANGSYFVNSFDDLGNPQDTDHGKFKLQ